ncbi:hypothetical protein Trydic_g11234 [Trypoxylus dichotomus]
MDDVQLFDDVQHVADDVDDDGEEEEEEEVNGRQFGKPITAEVGRVGGAARLLAAEERPALAERQGPHHHRRRYTGGPGLPIDFGVVFWGGFSVEEVREEDGSGDGRKIITQIEEKLQIYYGAPAPSHDVAHKWFIGFCLVEMTIEEIINRIHDMLPIPPKG